MSTVTRNIKKLLVLVAASWLLVAPGTVRAAGWPVMDLSNLPHNVATAVQAAKAVAHAATQIRNQATQIRNQVQSLRTLGDGAYSQLNGLFSGDLNQLEALSSSLGSIEYNMGQIEQQYERVFPPERDWSNIDISTYQDYFKSWNEEVQRSTKSAMQAQSVLSGVQEKYRQMMNILSQSQSADGEVRQLQASNLMLGLLSSQLNDLMQTTAATGRVTATKEAREAAERAARKRAAEHMMRNFTRSTEVPPIYDGPPRLKY